MKGRDAILEKHGARSKSGLFIIISNNKIYRESVKMLILQLRSTDLGGEVYIGSSVQ